MEKETKNLMDKLKDFEDFLGESARAEGKKYKAGLGVNSIKTAIFGSTNAKLVEVQNKLYDLIPEIKDYRKQ